MEKLDLRHIGRTDQREGNQIFCRAAAHAEQIRQQHTRQRVKEQHQQCRKCRLVDAAAQHIHQVQCPTALLGFPIQVLGPAVGNVQCADVYGIHRAQLVSVDRVMYAAADQQRHDQRAEVFGPPQAYFFLPVHRLFFILFGLGHNVDGAVLDL